MSLEIRLLEKSDVQDIFDFEMKKLNELIPNEIERDIAMWNSRWRKEVLEHYAPIGWSFIIKESEKILGYFLAQPLLFLDGQTQSLWVEHVQYASLQIRDELCEIAWKLAREKHLQKVYFPNNSSLANAVKTFKPEVWSPDVLQVKTTKAL